ncbi:MAG: putative signal transducing protein [Desulfocucumaceae bacterium]
MWTVVYIAPHIREAERIKDLLSSEGFLVKLKSVGLSQHNECGPVEILVPESEVEEAMETMTVYKLTGKHGHNCTQ